MKSLLYFKADCCPMCTRALELAGKLNVELVEVTEVVPFNDAGYYPKLVVGETPYYEQECINMLERMVRRNEN